MRCANAASTIAFAATAGCWRNFEPHGSCLNDSQNFIQASETVAVVGRRPGEFQWKCCKATGRHYVMTLITLFDETSHAGQGETALRYSERSVRRILFGKIRSLVPLA